MHKTKDQLYDMVKDLKSKSDFETAIHERFQQYDGLIDEDTIALFLVDELGRNKQSITKIAEIQPDTDCTVVGIVTTMQQPKTFKKKNGSSGKVVNLEIRDETGICRLVLWNDDTELGKQIQIGTKVKIVNGYVKNGFTGIEINLGRYGILEIEPKNNTDTSMTPPENITGDMIKGVLIKKEPTRAFFKDNGEFGFITTITLKEKDQEKQFTVWGEKVKEIQRFKIGDTITISKISQKKYNGKTELHLNGDSMITQG